jgi:hypothetical protein
LEGRINPVYHSVRRQDAQGLIAAPFTQNSVHPPFGPYTEDPNSVFMHKSAADLLR